MFLCKKVNFKMAGFSVAAMAVPPYSEVSNSKPQTECFQKKINSQLFKKCYFGGVMLKIEFEQMDMSYIMDSGQNRLYTTFPNIFSLLSADPANLSYTGQFNKKPPGK